MVASEWSDWNSERCSGLFLSVVIAQCILLPSHPSHPSLIRSIVQHELALLTPIKTNDWV